MRTQYCRQHIKKTAQECDLGDDIVSEVEKVDKFCGSNPAFADCATRPIYRLISEKDVDVRNKAILFAENALNEETPTGGKVRERLTEPEIIGFIRKARREVHGDDEEPKKKKPAPAEKPTEFPDHVPPADVTVPIPSDPAKPMQSSLGASIRASEMVAAGKNRQAAREMHVNPGAKVTINPVIINDTLRESPFQTAAQLKAHDADPLGIGPAPVDPVPAAPAEKIDPAKELKERRNRLAKELAATYSERTQRDIQDLIHENPTWRNGEADVFYFGIEALRNPQKVSAAPARSRA